MRRHYGKRDKNADLTYKGGWRPFSPYPEEAGVEYCPNEKLLEFSLASPTLPKSRQDEVYFRNMPGTYELYEWFTRKFPNVMIENCSGRRAEKGNRNTLLCGGREGQALAA